jgi:hypothetical protein
MQGESDAGEHTDKVVVNVLVRTSGLITKKVPKREKGDGDDYDKTYFAKKTRAVAGSTL